MNKFTCKKTIKVFTIALLSMAFSSSNCMDILASGADNGEVKIWDLSERRCLKKLPQGVVKEQSFNDVLSLAFSPDGSRLISGFEGERRGKAIAWDTSGWSVLKTLQFKNYKGFCSVSFSPNGEKVAFGEQRNGKIIICDVNENLILQTIDTHARRSGGVFVKFVTDERLVSFESANKNLTLWEDKKSGQRGFEKLYFKTLEGLAFLEFSPDGKKIALYHDNPFQDNYLKVVKVFDFHTDKLLRTLRCDYEVELAAFSQDGRLFAVAGRDNSYGQKVITIWDEKGEIVSTCHIAKGTIWKLAFSPDGKKLVASLKDGMIKIWNTSNGKGLMHFRGHKSTITSLAFKPVDQRLQKEEEERVMGERGVLERLQEETLATGMRVGKKKLLVPGGEIIFPLWASSEQILLEEAP